jgi:hypothetical protein
MIDRPEEDLRLLEILPCRHRVSSGDVAQREDAEEEEDVQVAVVVGDEDVPLELAKVPGALGVDAEDETHDGPYEQQVDEGERGEGDGRHLHVVKYLV